MNPFRPRRLFRWFGAATAALGSATHDVLAATNTATVPTDRRNPGRMGFAYEGVLGTSLDVQFNGASDRDARECEGQILREIDRLDQILNGHRTGTELSRVKAGGPVESRELSEVLATYDLWAERTTGALHRNLGGVTALWKSAAHSGIEPTAGELERAFSAANALDIDALGKSFIIDRAVEVGRNYAAAGLINVGGDI